VAGRFDGVNLPELIDALGIDRSLVYFPDQYRIVHYPFSDERMASFYSAMDVLLMPSAGEGFGIPTIEAQACGVPVVVSDFSAQPELVGAGWKVEGQRHYTPLKAWQFKPDISDIYEALIQSYGMKDRPDIAKKARKFAEGYDVEKVFTEHMLPALAEAEERFAERAPHKLEAVAA
jgi:glycosyltransferase involved in cell wall biosynthesis